GARRGFPDRHDVGLAVAVDVRGQGDVVPAGGSPRVDHVTRGGRAPGLGDEAASGRNLDREPARPSAVILAVCVNGDDVVFAVAVDVGDQQLIIGGRAATCVHVCGCACVPGLGDKSAAGRQLDDEPVIPDSASGRRTMGCNDVFLPIAVDVSDQVNVVVGR